MHPAYSVIFFTTASGLGYGLLMVLGVLGPLGMVEAHRGLGLAAFALAFAAVTAGLLSSTFHLGHPERAWRAFSQWRTSWLSREGVAAVATYVPTGLFAIGWVFWGENGGIWGWFGVVGALFSLLTVIATGMIYNSLPTIRAWADPLVTPIYVSLAVMTGTLWYSALTLAFGLAEPALAHLPMVAIVVAWGLKVWYWRRLDEGAPLATVATATGLGKRDHPVHLLSAPSTQENFVMREMGYRIARRHARKLRRVVQALAFFLPLVLIEAVLFIPETPILTAAAHLVAALSATAGIAVERWLFFAEARHVVSLYYGAETA